ncbi:thermonuclease family protein [Mesorhizobium silamurunense]|uniref:thermonuclease family protein n=1 Tax=Mesorhizobium silamurunense TaxID=499528 RepID=UPI00177F4C06|nr:thermonuclease family protein [Mesorhizobium silamurunense]
MSSRRAALWLGLLFASPAAAEPLVGVASVIDGDTVEIHGTRIRLNGIDAPESDQLCLDTAGKNYRCGQKAAFALADFLDAHRPLSCVEVDRDRYKRMVAVCTAGGVDIGEWMVSQGQALDWRKYSAGFYARAQREAMSAKRGLWAGSFTAPLEWRKQNQR